MKWLLATNSVTNYQLNYQIVFKIVIGFSTDYQMVFEMATIYLIAYQLKSATEYEIGFQNITNCMTEYCLKHLLISDSVTK